MRIVRTGCLWMACIAVALLGAPGLTAAQNAVLYEVTETMKVKRNDRVQARVATAALMGWVQADTALCPGWLAAALNIPACAITATATDSISLATGQGPVSGKFTVLIPGDNDVDGPELVVAEGSLQGTIDLSPAVLGWNGFRVPLGSISGRWSVRGTRGGLLDGLRAGGRLSGTFRLPFAGPAGGAAYMLNPYAFPGPDSFVAVTPAELSLGVPTVRLELTFVEAAQRNDD